jgi:hypothetical protein
MMLRLEPHCLPENRLSARITGARQTVESPSPTHAGGPARLGSEGARPVGRGGGGSTPRMKGEAP